MLNRCAIAGIFLLATVPSHAALPKVAVRAAPSGHWSSPNWLPFHANRFLTAAFTADGTPYDVVQGVDIAEGVLLDSALAPKYPILLSLSTETISDAEATAIAAYVQAGGMVYVSGPAWTRDENGQVRLDANNEPKFALGEQMGLIPTGWKSLDRVRVQTQGPMVDHLNLSEVYEWPMAHAYDNLNGLITRHAVFGARALPSSPPTIYLSGIQPAGFLSSLPWTSLPAGSWNSPQFAIAYGNIDGDPDGRDDLVYRIDDQVYVRLSNGQGFDPPGPPTTWTTDRDLRIADVDGDGKADLVGRSDAPIVSNQTKVWVSLSAGAQFGTPGHWTSWDINYDYQLADVDGDGKADIVGRSAATGDVQVSRSVGILFQGSTHWATLDPGTDMLLADFNGDGCSDLAYRRGAGIDVRLVRPCSVSSTLLTRQVTWMAAAGTGPLLSADVDGDNKADLLSPHDNLVTVALSTGSSFDAFAPWAGWSAQAPPATADVDGDGRSDLAGCFCNSTHAQSGELHVGLSSGFHPYSPGETLALSRKTYGNGVFVYNAEVVPLAGYGGFANDNTQYKTIRRTIEQAFGAQQLPLTSLSPWPYPYRAAMIYRHDHWLANDIHSYEKLVASPGEKFGEYYVLPEQANWTACPHLPWASNDYTQWTNNFPTGVSDLRGTGLLGAHTTDHVLMDDYGYAEAKQRLENTKTLIAQAAPLDLSPVFVAPAYYAIRKSSLQAIWDAGFLTTGEIGVGPFPHFTMDPTSASETIGSLLQLPTSEWPGRKDNIERMLYAPTINAAAKLAFELGGLINVYDHAAGDLYGYADIDPVVGCAQFSRYELAKGLLNYVQSLDNGPVQRIWRTNSLSIRNWRLQRDRHQIQPAVARTASTTRIDVTIAASTPIATTTFPEDANALRIALDTTSQTHAQARTQVTLRRSGSPDIVANCTDQSRVSCLGDLLFVKVSDATSVTIELGL